MFAIAIYLAAMIMLV